MNTLEPLVRIPIITDAFSPVTLGQRNVRCRDFEMRYMDCLQAYGLRNKEKCIDYFNDLGECLHHTKTRARITAMRWERTKQYLKDENDKRFVETKDGWCL